MRQTTTPRTTASPAFRLWPGPRLRTLLLLCLAVTGALLAGAAPVSAHAALTGSDPVQGSVVDKAPSRISLTFSEQVALSKDSLRVLDPKGKRVDTGKASEVSGTTYAVGLHSGLPDGTFTVTYQVVSADSHPVAGAFTFSVGAPSSTTVTASEQTVGGGVVGTLYGFGRYLSYAGFILLIGGAAFVLACWQRGAGERPVQRLVVAGWVALTVGTLALLLLRGSYTSTGKLADVFDLSALGAVLETKTGAALISRLLLLSAGALFIAVLFGAFARREAESREEAAEGPDSGASDAGVGDGTADEGAAADEDDEIDAATEKRDLVFGLAIGGSVVAIGLAATWALAEHASTGVQTAIAMPVDVVHLLSVAIWLGGLAALLTALFSAPSIEASAVRRFSRLAFVAVAVVAATGVYQGWRQIGTWSALTGTSYGQLLLVKVGLVAVMLGVAWISRRWTGQLAETPAGVASEETEAEAAAETEADAEASVPVSASASASVPASASASASAKATTAAAAVSAKGSGGAAPQGPGVDGDASSEASETTGTSLRATQLARQQAAMATARVKRARNADPLRSGLRRSVLAETAVAVVVLAVTTVLTSTEPGRTVEEAKAASAAASASDSSTGALTLDMPFDTGGQDGKGLARIDFDPARVGGNTMHVFVERPNGRAFDVPEVKVAFTLESQKIGPLSVTPDRIATGHWTAKGVQIPVAGDWKVSVTVRTSDIDQVTVNKNAQIG